MPRTTTQSNKNEKKTETSLLAQETALRAAIQHMLAAASTQTGLIIVVTISRPNTAYREGLILPPCPGYCCAAEKKRTAVTPNLILAISKADRKVYKQSKQN